MCMARHMHGGNLSSIQTPVDPGNFIAYSHANFQANLSFHGRGGVPLCKSLEILDNPCILTAHVCLLEACNAKHCFPLYVAAIF